MTAAQWLFTTWLACIPRSAPRSVVSWAEQHVRLVGSARSETFRSDISPWTREPMECANDGTRKMTLVKPIQAGGTAVGEVALLFWLSHWSSGDIQANWQNDQAADERWKKHMEKKIRSCAPVMARISPDRFLFTRGLIVFPHANFIMQGIYSDRSVASDSIRGQVNEELHDEDGWLPGRLEQAYGRTTAFWNSVIFNISNAGKKGSQLHTAFTSGTQQHWEVKCPGCGQYHRMQTRWDTERPDLGGLRYDVDGCRLDTGEVNYQKLLPSIRFQMPCGYQVHDVVNERRSLSLSGRYSKPTNNGAPLTERSYTLEAVSVDYIPWVELIRKKHLALRARRLGDPKPWLDYLRERECQFIGIEDRRPEAVAIVLSSRRKDREGLPQPRARFAFWDYQVGRKDAGESPHFWGVVQDFAGGAKALIVWEGKCESEGEMIDVLKRHDVDPSCVGVDASFTGEDRYIYSLCLRRGWNAIKVHGHKSGEKTFTHADGIKRAWSEPEPLWPMVPSQKGPTKSEDESGDEPLFWNISQSGAMDALAHLRAQAKKEYEIPADVSDDFKQHFLPWSLEDYTVPMTNQKELRWKKASDKAPDHLFMCCTYLALWAEMAGITGVDVAPPDEKTDIRTGDAALSTILQPDRSAIRKIIEAHFATQRKPIEDEFAEL